MALIRKFLVLFVLGLVTLTSACKEESTKKADSETHPAVVELLQAIEQVELAEARGLALTSSSPETIAVFKRILNRSKAAAGLLRIDTMDLTGLTELVRSRDELRTVTLLTEDVDTVGIYKKALEKAVMDLAVVQGVRAYDLSDPSIYHELFAQTFDLQQKLGEFSSFAEIRDAKGPKLFEAGTCGEVCGNSEYIFTDVNKNQAVWLLAPKMTLPDSEDMLLTLSGYVRGESLQDNIKGYRLYVSEVFDGRFTTAEGQWTDITDTLDRYLPKDKGAFTANVDLNPFRGKSVTFAIRVQGFSNTATMYQMNSFTVKGKGRAVVTPFTLEAPEPLLIKEPKNESCVIADGMIDVKESCRLVFDAPDSFSQLVDAGENSPFKKFQLAGPKFEIVKKPGQSWKEGSNCTPKPENTSLISGFCVQRAAPQGRDLLVSPSIKLDGNISVKIQYAVVGPTLNKTGLTERLRVLLFDQLTFNAGVIALTDMNGSPAVKYDQTVRSFDVQLQGYPAPYVTPKDAKRGELILDPASLAAKGGTSGKPFRLALAQILDGDPSEAGDNKTTVWHVYSIDFVKPEQTDQ